MPRGTVVCTQHLPQPKEAARTALSPSTAGPGLVRNQDFCQEGLQAAQTASGSGHLPLLPVLGHVSHSQPTPSHPLTHPAASASKGALALQMYLPATWVLSAQLSLVPASPRPSPGTSSPSCLLSRWLAVGLWVLQLAGWGQPHPCSTIGRMGAGLFLLPGPALTQW